MNRHMNREHYVDVIWDYTVVKMIIIRLRASSHYYSRRSRSRKTHPLVTVSEME